jgi:TM2 domain-containing membrane protein YozV
MNKAKISDEKKLTLLLLCWLFGWLGMHRFYTGKYATGLMQLGSFLFGGFVVYHLFADKHMAHIMFALFLGGTLLWILIDFLRIIMGKFTDKEGKPIIDWV